MMKHLGYTILFCLIMWGPWTGPAEAIPVAGDYTFGSALVNGTFHSSGTALTTWFFHDSFSPRDWYGASPLSPGTYIGSNNVVTFTQSFGFQDPSIQIVWTNSTLIIAKSDGDNNIVLSNYIPFSTTAVPEPSAVHLIAIGLLGIAGYRWLHPRREGLQIG